MLNNYFLCCVVLEALAVSVLKATTTKKHVIFIVADDLGWNDVGFHGSEFPTPNLDALASSGVILGNYYVSPICTPSRSEMLTGKYAIHTGMQHNVIEASGPWGLGLNERLLPEYLKSAGYDTHLIGKWHLGYFRSEYTPTFRGFDSHFGYWTGKEDYWSHATDSHGMSGIDYRDGIDPVSNESGVYSTSAFTQRAVHIIRHHAIRRRGVPLYLQVAHQATHSGNADAPLEAPAKYVESAQRLPGISSYARQMFAAMAMALDDSVGRIVAELRRANMLQDSIIVFTTDNGGPAAGFDLNMACNWPLRGVKHTLWEGGVRGTAFVWSTALKNPGRVSETLIHAVDWLPTLIEAVGVTVEKPKLLDGIDLWKSIAQSQENWDAESERRTVLHNIDDLEGFYAYRSGDYKLLFFQPGSRMEMWNGWYAPGEVNTFGLASLNTNASDMFFARRPLGPSTIASARGSYRTTTLAVEKAVAEAFPDRSFERIMHRVECGSRPTNATRRCSPIDAPCLFNVRTDPCEYRNIAQSEPAVVRLLADKVAELRRTAVKPRNRPFDPEADPKLHGGFWSSWKDGNQ